MQCLEVFLFTCLQGEEIFCYEWQAKDGVYAWEKIELNWEVIHQTHEDYLDLNPLELADLPLTDHMRFQLTVQVLRARQVIESHLGRVFLATERQVLTVVPPASHGSEEVMDSQVRTDFED